LTEASQMPDPAADPSRGRFRSFPLTSLKNFLAHERDKAGALKRGGGATTLSLDADDAETRFGLKPADVLTPDVLFERRWAATLMEQAMTAERPERFPKDLDALKLRALEEGLPYQTLISSLLHKYVSGRL